MKNKRKKKVATKAQGKMYAYLVSLASNNDFVDQVAEIRRKFSLPERGFPVDLKDELKYVNSLPSRVAKNGEETDFQKEVYELAVRFDVSVAWLNSISDYVLYNDFFFTRVAPMVQMVDVLGLLKEIEKNGDDEDDERTAQRVLDTLTDSLPMAIFLSPYATGRDIIDYVKKEYKKQIEPAQSVYREKGVKIGKVRKRNYAIQERNMFICKYKNLPSKDLMERLNKKYGTNFDYTYINKIIAKMCPKEK